MRIVQLAVEFAPIAKAGGLGEVVVGLTRELTRLGETVDVILPKYDFIDLKKVSNLKLEVADFKCLQNGSWHSNSIWSAECEGCLIHLLEPHHPAGYFRRDQIYGYADDIARFTYFTRAALEYLKLKKEPIDILHLHDWHTAIAAPLVRDLFKQELPVQGIALSIHNVEYQGKCAVHDLDAIGLKGSQYLTPDKLQDDHSDHPFTINLLKGGIVYSDEVIAVSPTYAKEILTPEKGFHLDPTLRKIRSKLTGILNGIDQKLWDPNLDESLSAHYASTSTLTTIVSAKESIKQVLRKQFQIDKSAPWIGCITRLVPQKGPELIEEAIRQTLSLGGVFFLLGSSPIPTIQQHFEQLKAAFKKNRQLVLHLEYDERLAHQLYAALDFLLVPSHHEPCGLTQLIAMRYGTVPIVSATGGLKDTVFDCEDTSTPVKRRNGFTFSKPTFPLLTATLQRAFHLYRTDSTAFRTLIQRGMQSNFSWEKPTQEYLKHYRNFLKASS